MQSFKWAMLAKHVGGKAVHRVNNRYNKLTHKYNFDNITSPTTIDQIDIFERNNPGVSVNVYGLDVNNNIYPRRVVKEVKDDHTNLLLLCETTEDADLEINSHYCWIKNFDRLLKAQLSKYHQTIVVCRQCFRFYNSRGNGKRKLKEHEEFCAADKMARIDMLKDDRSIPTAAHAQ